MPITLKCCLARQIRLLAAMVLLTLAFPAAVLSATLRVAVISDLNGSYGSTVYHTAIKQDIARLVELKPDLIISTGDMVAGQRLHPPLTRDVVESMWSAFHTHVTDPIHAAGIPFAVTPGNHDASAYPAFTMERAIYREQWQERTNGLHLIARANYPFNYAFALGDVLFISLDATRVGPLDDDQRRWLDELLRQEGGRYRHRVAFGHLPIYPFSQGRETEVTADHELEQLLHDHGVEVYLSGHHHAFYPGVHGGIRHIGQACLGAGPRRLIGTSRVTERAVTWLVFGHEDVTVKALTGPVLERAIDLSTLPESIESRYGTLVRDDLRPVKTRRKGANGSGSIAALAEAKE
ncbi:MAG: metallophosphoesterase [Halieaceae bacterium]|jgi:hypothetical protein|nr:metallophosphoesterase [Halieaceae bacterium]